VELFWLFWCWCTVSHSNARSLTILRMFLHKHTSFASILWLCVCDSTQEVLWGHHVLSIRCGDGGIPHKISNLPNLQSLPTQPLSKKKSLFSFIRKEKKKYTKEQILVEVFLLLCEIGLSSAHWFAAHIEHCTSCGKGSSNSPCNYMILRIDVFSFELIDGWRFWSDRS
jgi:hypothetical protein